MSIVRITLDQLNALPAGAFISTLSGVFEHSPWVAEAALWKRPFTSIDQLHDVMTTIVDQAGVKQQLALINAHPELAGKAAVRGELTDESRASKAAPASICARRKSSTDCRR
jgi:2-oxo-4-hydroxy-4-carboxy-5-ureidoimidazoline decarboxylase